MKDNNEPAFPSYSNQYGPVQGISMRDYFAAKAMEEIMSRQEAVVPIPYKTIATHCYLMADAMLAERAK